MLWFSRDWARCRAALGAKKSNSNITVSMQLVMIDTHFVGKSYSTSRKFAMWSRGEDKWENWKQLCIVGFQNTLSSLTLCQLPAAQTTLPFTFDLTMEMSCEVVRKQSTHTILSPKDRIWCHCDAYIYTVIHVYSRRLQEKYICMYSLGSCVKEECVYLNLYACT